MTCPFCRADNVEEQITLDLYCTGAPTIQCRCPACDLVWFDDTDGGVEGVD